MLRKIARYLQEIYHGKETIELREELERLGYPEEARGAHCLSLDLDGDGCKERYVLVGSIYNGRLYTLDEKLEDTGIVTRRYSKDYGGVRDVHTSYQKAGCVIKEEKFTCFGRVW